VIRITCTNCRQTLTIDDGFAGGVCRCQHCGTIQTVPIPGKTRGPAPVAKTLYRSERKADAAGSGSGLDQLAEIVSSSGLRGNAMRMRPAPARPPKNRMVLALAVAAALIVLLVAVIAMLLMNNSRTPPPRPPQPSPQQQAQTPPAAPGGPNFAGMSLTALDTVIYLIDDGGSASDVLSGVESACFASIKSLGPEKRFKVIFWRNGSPTYPADGTARATEDQLTQCEDALRDEYAQGNTQVDGALRQAMDQRPDAIVLVTAKAAQLSDDFVRTVMSIRGDSGVRIYTVGINGDSTMDPSKPGILADLAARTDAAFLSLTAADLSKFGN